MTKQVIDIGNAPNDGTGDQLRVAFDKVNDNTDETYLAGPVGTNIKITGNTVSSLQNSIILAPFAGGNNILKGNTEVGGYTSGIVIPGEESTLSVSGATNLTGLLTATNIEAQDVTVNGVLSLPGDVTVGGNFQVNGTTLLGATTINGIATVNFGVQAVGPSSFETLSTSSTATLDSLVVTTTIQTLDISATGVLTAQTGNVTGLLTVTGNARAADPVANEDLVTLAYFNANSGAGGGLTSFAVDNGVESQFTVDEDDSYFTISSADSNVKVDFDSGSTNEIQLSLQPNVTINTDLTVQNDINVTNDVDVGSTLTVGGSATVTGVITSSSNITAGGFMSTDDLRIPDNTSAPLTAEGAPGDLQGMIRWSNSGTEVTMYLCFEGYTTGGINIWDKIRFQDWGNPG